MTTTHLRDKVIEISNGDMAAATADVVKNLQQFTDYGTLQSKASLFAKVRIILAFWERDSMPADW